MEIKSIEHNKKDLICSFKAKNSKKAFIDDFYKIIGQLYKQQLTTKMIIS